MPMFKNKHMEDFLDLFRDFEVKKREIGPQKDSKITFRIPAAFSDAVKDMRNGQRLEEVIKKTKYGNQVNVHVNISMKKLLCLMIIKQLMIIAGSK